MIVAIEGASTELSLALAEPDGTLIADDGWTSAQRQSAELLPRLLGLLDRSNRTLGDLGAVAVGLGPGSFTGLRVAMALGKGLALAAGRPLVGIPSLVAWLDADAEARAALARAGAREAYLLVRDDAELRVVDGDALPERARTDSVAAPGELATAFGLARATAPMGAAAAIARLAAERLATDADGDDLERLEPIYVRGPRGVPTTPEGSVRWL
ncbi:MAG: tRNA (adenosine(37)-N6)-threonylcarbamoyltransferase complex dimerization subunit type 1 TsaB [Candidatus Limnocylindria bacterium]